MKKLLIIFLIAFTGCQDLANFFSSNHTPPNDLRFDNLLFISDRPSLDGNGELILEVNIDSTFDYYSFQGTIIYDRDKVIITKVETGMPSGMFVWNKDLPILENGMFQAKFAFADYDKIGHTTKNLVKMRFLVTQSAKICIEDFLHDESMYKEEICAKISK